MIMSDKDNDKKSRTTKSSKSPQKSDDTMADKLVEAALQSHLMQYAEKKTEKKKTINDITNLINEHLSSFIILGYTYDGDPVSIVTANTQQEADSICALVNKFIVHSSGPI